MMRWSRQIVMAAALAASTGVLAQPAGPGMEAFGPHLAAIKAQLNLTAAQEAQWAAALAEGKRARESARGNLGRLRSAMAAELAKAEPDLASVAALSDSVQQENQALRRQARNQWLALYSGFSAAQKAVVREAMKARIDRFEEKGYRRRPPGI